MKKVFLTAILSAFMLSLSACNSNSNISEDAYNNVVSERDELLMLNAKLENKLENTTATQTETTTETESETYYSPPV